MEGLQVGELVVSNGSFKIDSALQIMAKPSMMNPSEQIHTIRGVPEAFHQQLEPLLALYFELSHALSHDNLTDARTAARKLPAAVQAPQHDLLPMEGHEAFSAIQAEILAAATAIDETSSIQAARRAYYALSEATIHMVRLFGASKKSAIHVYHCPMARDGRGADWLQNFMGTENPYYGSAMFRCGELTETLIEPTAAASDDVENNH
jgi:Cu(I)/Ag(I) efflux system membrane fusion protein